MRPFSPLLLLLALLRPFAACGTDFVQRCDPSTAGTIYQYNARTLNGSRSVNFGDFAGKSFPCNQFGKQEPGTRSEIFPGLKYVRPGNGFVPNFLLMEKGDVNGKNEQRVFTFLKRSCPPVGDDFGAPYGRLFWEPLKVNDIKWNFEKFLVGPDGKAVMRWHPRVNMSTVRTDIRNYLLRLYTQ